MVGRAARVYAPTVIRAARVRAELRNVLAVDQRLLAAALGHAKATCEVNEGVFTRVSDGDQTELYIRTYMPQEVLRYAALALLRRCCVTLKTACKDKKMACVF